MKIKTQATLLLLIGTLFWGMTFVFIKEGISIINLYTFLGYRFIIAGVLLGIIFYRRLKYFNIETLKYGLLLSIPLLISYITQTIGLQYTSASKGGFITGLSVVFVPIFLAILHRRIPKINHVVAVVLAAIGLAFLTLSESLTLNIGDIWVFVFAIAFAIYIIMVSKYSKFSDSILITIVQLLSVGVISILISIGIGRFVFPKGYLVWQAIIFTSVFATAFVYAIQNHYQKFISEVKAAIIFSFEPLFAVITAYFYLNEEITIQMVIGGLLIFIGMISAELKIKK